MLVAYGGEWRIFDRSRVVRLRDQRRNSTFRQVYFS